MSGQAVDPTVSRAKFDREIAGFREHETRLRQRGWMLLEADFPTIVMGFLTPHMTPRVLLFVVRVDFTNYDTWPPSVQFLDPMTRAVLPLEAVPPLLRAQAEGPPANMVQGIPGHPAFLCLTGVREYHDNPGHTGDSWLLHRGKGGGNLYFICDQISKYGSEVMLGYGIQAQVVLQRAEPPA